jgi:hypothetical protein
MGFLEGSGVPVLYVGTHGSLWSCFVIERSYDLLLSLQTNCFRNVSFWYFKIIVAGLKVLELQLDFKLGIGTIISDYISVQWNQSDALFIKFIKN